MKIKKSRKVKLGQSFVRIVRVSQKRTQQGLGLPENQLDLALVDVLEFAIVHSTGTDTELVESQLVRLHLNQFELVCKVIVPHHWDVGKLLKSIHDLQLTEWSRHLECVNK